MDLRPINPYYQTRKVRTRSVRTRSLLQSDTYSYPYTWIEPVTDRTQADVEEAAELLTMTWAELTAEQQAAFQAGLKGCMNYADFLRIENNVQILLDVLELDLSSYVEAVPEFLTESYYQNLQDNIAAIRAAFCIHADTPKVPELPYNTWEKYNDLEKVLADVYEVVNAQFHYFAGDEICAGDETGLLL